MKIGNLGSFIFKSLLGISLGVNSFLFAASAQETLEVSSSAFAHNANIPLKYSAYGDNTSPAISWGDLPEGTKQVALILDDPIVAMPQPFVHWVAYNIPASASGLPEGLSTDAKVVDVPQLSGMINGVNGTRRTGYFGPRPPVDGKVHNYNFTVYALDLDQILPQGLNKEGLLKAMEGKILASGTLTGNYQQTE